MSDPRDAFIARVVRGKSFADVGGLWGTVNEKVSVAHAAGAASLAMVDISEWGDRWNEFETRRRQLGASGGGGSGRDDPACDRCAHR